MKNQNNKGDEAVACINCITGKTEEVIIKNNTVVGIAGIKCSKYDLPFIGPGLIDLQINGINGIDFNSPFLTQEDVVKATQELLSKGITTFLPTIITNSDENILKMVHTIYQACLTDPLVNGCIWGIHLEGPFISPVAGAKGAHDEKYIKSPDWDLVNKFQKEAGGKIKLITIAPEWEGVSGFIKKCTDNNIIVSIGHSMANSEQIARAVKAGATLSTHLGNAVPLLLPRHPNIIWDQLASEALYTSIITDGIHIDDSFIKVVMKMKGNRTLLVSDATCFAGMPPGEYQNHIGGTVILDNKKRLSMKNNPGMLAGAAKTLLENVEYLINQNLSTLSHAWQMASENVAKMLLIHDDTFNHKNDKVIFQFVANKIQVMRVIKNGKVVFKKSS